jgi:hypothetical protein
MCDRFQTPPKDAKESVEQAILSQSFHEMFTLIRGAHILSTPGSLENKVLEKFFLRLIETEWKDAEEVRHLIMEGGVILDKVISGTLEDEEVEKEEQTEPIKEAAVTEKPPQRWKSSKKQSQNCRYLPRQLPKRV